MGGTFAAGSRSSVARLTQKRNRTCDELVVDKIRGRAILPSSLSPITDRDRDGPQVYCPPDTLVGRRVNILARAEFPWSAEGRALQAPSDMQQRATGQGKASSLEMQGFCFLGLLPTERHAAAGGLDLRVGNPSQPQPQTPAKYRTAVPPLPFRGGGRYGTAAR
jgi:hypothetical protein